MSTLGQSRLFHVIFQDLTCHGSNRFFTWHQVPSSSLRDLALAERSGHFVLWLAVGHKFSFSL